MSRSRYSHNYPWLAHQRIDSVFRTRTLVKTTQPKGVTMPTPSLTPEPKTTAKQTAADKRAEDQRKIRAALRAALAVPQNQHVLNELAKR